MPFGDYEDFDACVRDNQDKQDPEAYCAEIKRQIEAATLSEAEEKALERSECDPGYVQVDGECRPVGEVSESVESPPSLLSTPQHLTLKSLDTEPIERIEEGDGQVRYTSIKLLSPGVWADAGSETATYYPPDGIANLEPDYDEGEHDGPPVNIMHDLDVDAWEAHEPSIAGHIDPETLGTDDDGNLHADLVFDTSRGAGAFADENLQSTLEKEGTVGFGGPSVEIPARGLQQSHDPARDMPRVDGGLLTGCAMVMDPASKSVNFAREAARRPIAMASGTSGESGKVLTKEDTSMRTLADPSDVRDVLEDAGINTDDMSDEEVMAIAEQMDALDETDESGGPPSGDGGESEEDDGGMEAGDYPDDEKEEEDDEDDDTEMADGGDVEALQETVQNLKSRLEDLEDAVSQAMTADDVNSELEDAAGSKLADAESVEALREQKEELDRRLSNLEEQGKQAKTLADAGGEDGGFDYSEADGGVDYDPATRSMSSR